jgi:hypothetical protein
VSEFSDAHKEVYGVRPRFHGGWSEERLARGLADLYDRAEAETPEDPIVPASGEGWTLITDDANGAPLRLEEDYYQYGG